MGSGAAGRRGGLIYRILADAVVGLHSAFVLFVMLGGLLLLRWPWIAYLHVPAALWGAAIEFEGWICPLTPLENWLRRQAGTASYSGGFVEHYISPLLYPSALTRSIQLALGVIVIAANIGIYGHVFRKKHIPPLP